jgi:hypothetical protein
MTDRSTLRRQRNIPDNLLEQDSRGAATALEEIKDVM